MKFDFPLDVASIDSMARTAWGEARDQGPEGMSAVCWVILNRTIAHHQGVKTINGICAAPLQFSCWNKDDPNRVAANNVDLKDPQFREAWRAALDILSENYSDPTGGARWYHTAAKPAWAETWPPAWVIPGDEGIRIGDHVFYARAR